MNVATCLPFKIDGTLCISQSNGPGIVACGVLSNPVPPSCPRSTFLRLFAIFIKNSLLLALRNSLQERNRDYFKL